MNDSERIKLREKDGEFTVEFRIDDKLYASLQAMNDSQLDSSILAFSNQVRRLTDNPASKEKIAQIVEDHKSKVEKRLRRQLESDPESHIRQLMVAYRSAGESGLIDEQIVLDMVKKPTKLPKEENLIYWTNRVRSLRGQLAASGFLLHDGTMRATMADKRTALINDSEPRQSAKVWKFNPSSINQL
jgi:hypothetical protein